MFRMEGSRKEEQEILKQNINSDRNRTEKVKRTKSIRILSKQSEVEIMSIRYSVRLEITYHG